MTASQDHNLTPINQTDKMNVGPEGRYVPSQPACYTPTHPSCHAAIRRRGIFYLVAFVRPSPVDRGRVAGAAGAVGDKDGERKVYALQVRLVALQRWWGRGLQA
ncbi:MAG: hypothetical protein RL040_901 [Bacteroidota bacterium]|jgi:hypothetical protein